VFEHRNDPLLPWPVFRRRAIHHAGGALFVLFVVLLLGMAIYHWADPVYELLCGASCPATKQLGWIESFLNASMLLGGMGPVDNPATPLGKISAGLYALFAGLVFVSAVGYMGAPWLHRLLHHLHLETTGAGTPHDRSHRPPVGADVKSKHPPDT
jgi:hypothetical protein